MRFATIFMPCGGIGLRAFAVAGPIALDAAAALTFGAVAALTWEAVAAAIRPLSTGSCAKAARLAT